MTGFLSRLQITCFALVAAIPALAADWPAPGSRFPAALDAPRAEVSAERLGTAVWTNPPAVISPAERSWYDYQGIIWGGQVGELSGRKDYYDALRGIYIRSSMVYSQDNPRPSLDAGMSFYNTCITNQLYIRNKTADKSRNDFKARRDRASAVRYPSLEDPKLDASERANAAQAAQRNATHLPLAYDLRDEASYTTGSANPHDFDFSPVSLAAFRQWLQTKYDSLDELNKQWETSFARWDDVTPLMTDGIRTREYKRLPRMNLAPWADHREYNDDTFLAAIARYGQEIERRDPGAPFGISGTQMPSAWGGFDFYKLCRATNWIEHYDVCGSRELIRVFLPEDYPSIRAMDYRNLDAGMQRMWKYVLHGDSGGLVWPYQGPTTKNVLFTVSEGRIGPTEAGRTLAAIFAEARSGIPCLLRRAEMQTDPVAILYSQASLRADWLLEIKSDGSSWYNRYSSYESSHNFAAAGREGFYKLLEDLGLQYTCLASQQLEQGELARRGIKLLIVPRGLALSAAEIEALKAFVSGGGVLLTDVLVGRMDENCRVRYQAPRPIDELLGVTRGAFDFQADANGAQGGFGAPVRLTMAADFGTLRAGEAIEVQGFQETGLAVSTGRALAQSGAGPVLIENRYGQGVAYTLNFDIPNYITTRTKENVGAATAPYRRVMEAVLQKAGIQPVVALSRKGTGQYPVGIETFRYQLGGSTFVAAHINGSVRVELDLSDSGAGVADVGQGALKFQLPQKGYVTEMRTGTSLGLVDTVELTMVRDRPLILAVLPYEVKGLAVEAAPAIVDGKLPISLKIQGDGPVGDHVVHAELLDAAGQTVPQSVVNVPLPKGSYQGALDLSLVPGAGPWKLKLTDVASGKSFQRDVKK